MTSTGAVVNLKLGINGYRQYDWRDAGTPRGRKRRVKLTEPVARYEQVARLLRQRITRGDWLPGVTMPGAPTLAAEYGVTQSVAQRALETIVAWGYARTGAGRGTVVLARRRYRAEVPDIRWTGGDVVIPEKAFTAAADAVAAAEETDPAVTDADLTGNGPLLAISMDVEAANPARAGDIAWAIAEVACRGGWDLAGASVQARPADGD
jgi:hypothetical protein